MTAFNVRAKRAADHLRQAEEAAASIRAQIAGVDEIAGLPLADLPQPGEIEAAALIVQRRHGLVGLRSLVAFRNALSARAAGDAAFCETQRAELRQALAEYEARIVKRRAALDALQIPTE